MHSIFETVRAMPTYQLLFSIIPIILILRALVPAYVSSLHHIPGPWFAKFSRLWLLQAYAARSFHQTNLNLHRRYGPVVRIAPNEYSIDDPEAAKILYRASRQLAKSSRYLAWGVPTHEQNVFSAVDIARHTERRKQTAQLYQLSNLSNFEPQLDHLTQHLLNRLSDLSGSAEVVKINLWFHYYALDAIGTIALGKPFGLLDKGGDVASLMAAVQRYSRYGAIVGVFPELHPAVFRLVSAMTPTGAHGLGYLAKFMNQAIDEEALAEEKPDDMQHHLVSMLFAMHRRDPVNFTHDDVRFHILPAIGGGSDTTAATIGAVIYNLVRSPSALYSLRQELNERERNGKITHPMSFREAQECPYLQAVIKETLRIYSGAGLPMPRIVPEGGLTLAGRYFPAGTVVGINAWVSSYNQNIFGADAAVFRPERWLHSDPEQLTRMNDYFLTFGKGPRSCLGKNISLLELSKLIPELVLHFDFEMADGIGAEWTLVNDWFVRQKDFRVKVHKRRPYCAFG